MATDKTIFDGNATLRDSDFTLREDDSVDGRNAAYSGGSRWHPAHFRSTLLAGMSVMRQLPTQGSEADIFVVDDGAGEKILKLYRLGLDPKREVLDRYEAISAQYPEHVVQVFRTGRDQETGRWFELLELVHYGSVADWLEKGASFNFEEFVRELGSAVNALHEAGIIHRDLKPGNVLVRSPQPLDLVLTDFGIASILDNASIRETVHKGFTPMYAAPEDTTGQIVSGPADWWACGMIFLEILTGSHPFRNLPPSRVVYFLSTRNVEIDSSLPEAQQVLLKGLLTRNDKKRWGWPQIEAWLRGERNIPVHYEDSGVIQAGSGFRFMGKNFQNLHDMAIAFADNYEAWKAGRGTLARGNIAKWLQDTHEFDEERIVSDELAENNADLYLARFIAHYAPELPPNLYGLELTSTNVLAWVLKPQDQLTDAETGILNIIFSGRPVSLVAFLKIYQKDTDPHDASLRAIAGEKWHDREDLQLALRALLMPEKFYWGPSDVPQGPAGILRFLKMNRYLLTQEKWEELDGPNIIIPPGVQNLFQAGHYDQAIAELVHKKRDGALLYVQDGLCTEENFYGDDLQYMLLVGRKNGFNKNDEDLFNKISQLVKSIEDSTNEINENLKNY